MSQSSGAIRVAIDTNVLIYALRAEAAGNPEQRELRVRALILFDMLNEAKANIVVPTPCVAEYLVGIYEARRGKLLTELSRRFECASFDLQAAELAARVWREAHADQGGKHINRNTLKADVMIVAAAKAAGAQRLYSHDAQCRRVSECAGLPSRDLPTHHEDMFIDREFRQAANPPGAK